MTEDSRALTPLSQARQMLATATTPEDFRQLRDLAAGARAWAQSRQLGIDAENEAAEVILRAERGIGQIILAGKEAGAIGEGNPKLRTTNDVPTTISDITGLPSHDRRNWQWQQVAAMPEEDFERQLRETRERGERIAKVNFYQRPSGPRTPPPDDGPRTPRAFEQFRDGVQGLVGWTIDSEGQASATKNLLLQLPDDELAQVKALVEVLAGAYGEAVRARRRVH